MENEDEVKDEEESEDGEEEHDHSHKNALSPKSILYVFHGYL